MHKILSVNPFNTSTAHGACDTSEFDANSKYAYAWHLLLSRRKHCSTHFRDCQAHTLQLNLLAHDMSRQQMVQDNCFSQHTFFFSEQTGWFWAFLSTRFSAKLTAEACILKAGLLFASRMSKSSPLRLASFSFRKNTCQQKALSAQSVP